MKTSMRQTWDLHSIFPDGSSSEAFQMMLHQLGEDIQQFSVHCSEEQSVLFAQRIKHITVLTDELQSISQRLREADSFTACLAAERMEDRQAIVLSGVVRNLQASFEAALTVYDQVLARMGADEWNELLQDERLAPLAFHLNERRNLMLEKLTPELEALAADLAVDGYHGWAETYQTIVGRLRIPYESEGQIQQLSAGQAANKLNDPERTVRSTVFREWEQAWAGYGDLCSDALNRIAGFRLKLYQRRGWNDVLQEPLAMNRMSRQTLDTMWHVIVQHKPVFVEYLRRKAELLGLKALTWYDVHAPIGKSGERITYAQGAQTIIDQFSVLCPSMADLARKAFASGWIEAEDRPGKRPGGFCTSFPLSKQTRIFMTYAGTPDNVSTLAHELGHAYHQFIMDDMPEMSQQYAMNVAETASTFAEWIVADAAVKHAFDREEQIRLLDEKIMNSIAFFMNIHARFLFETRMYEARKKRMLSVEQLNQLMEEAQQEAYCGILTQYHPLFWASKLHFYLTDVPFYNFPYTFGYLFSAGLYARAQEEGPAFEARYQELLRDTGRMQVEDLAQKHLQADLRKTDFWQTAIQMTLKDVSEFMQLTKK